MGAIIQNAVNTVVSVWNQVTQEIGDAIFHRSSSPPPDSYTPASPPPPVQLDAPPPPPSPAPTQAVNVDVHPYAQGAVTDSNGKVLQIEPWATSQYLDDKVDSVGEIGCTLTTIAMAARWVTADASIDPGSVDRNGLGWATSKMAYTHLGDPLGHKLMWLNQKQSCLSPVTHNSPDEAKLLDAVSQSLRQGNPVALGLQVSASGEEPANTGHGGALHLVNWVRHTVLAVGLDDQGQILINDPATGGTRPLSDYTSRHSFRGFDMADEIDKPSSATADSADQAASA